MQKDVPSFKWPGPFDDGGKLYRFLLDTATEHALDNGGYDGGGYQTVREKVADFKKRVGEHSVETATAIAFAYLGHLVAHGVIPPLKETMYR